MKISAKTSLLSAVGALCTGLVLAAFAGEARAGVVPESEPNEPLPLAQNVDAFFTLGFDPSIEDSAGINTSLTIPHVEIVSPGDGTVQPHISSNSIE